MAPLGSWLCPEPGVAALPAPPPAGPAAGAPGTWTRAQPPRGKMLRSGEERGEAASQGCTGCLGCPPSLWGPAGWRVAPHTLGGSGFGGGFHLFVVGVMWGEPARGAGGFKHRGAGLWGTPGSQEAMDGLKRVAQARAELGMVAGRLSASLLCSRQGKAAQQGGSAGRQPRSCAQSQALCALHRLPKAKNPTALSKAAPQMGYSTSPELP